jgi:hypothetical protein
VVVEQGQEEFVDCAFGEEEVVVGHYRLLVARHEGLVVLRQLAVHLLVLGGELLYLGQQFLLLEFVVFYYRLLQLLLESFDLPLEGIPVALVETLEMVLQRLFVVLDAVHGLFEEVVVGLSKGCLTSSSVE